jgi:hypothetical protein
VVRGTIGRWGRLTLRLLASSLIGGAALATAYSFSFVFGLLATLAVLTTALAAIVIVPFATGRASGGIATSLAFALACAWQFVPLEERIADAIHLAIMYPVYAAAIRNDEAGSAARTEFNWSGRGLVGSAEVDRTLVYDPSDATASIVGRKELLGTGPLADYKTAIALFGHFYVVETQSL